MIKFNIKRYLTPWQQEGKNQTFHARGNALFELRYKNKLIGTLRHIDNNWIFQYSEEYKQNPFVTPLVNFPDINKTYISEEIPPFFAARIPTVNKPAQKAKLKKHNADPTDLIAMLEIFGRYNVNNPFELKLVK